MNQDTSYGLYFLGLCLAIGLIFASFIAGQAIRDTRTQTISVKGVAERMVKSDQAIWETGVTAQSPTLPEAYAKIKTDMDQLMVFLKTNGIDEKSVDILPISKMNVMQLTPEGRESGIVSGYRLSQSVRVRSNDVDMIAKLQQQANGLLAEGLDLNSYSPQYNYTQLESLKVEMLSEATKNAMQRAQEMASNTGNRIGGIRSARQGVFQITNPTSNDVSDYGYSDTSSIDKRVRAIVSIDFTIKN